MGILISTFSTTPRDFNDDENKRLDDLSLSISTGNWWEHLDLLGLERSDDHSIDDYEAAAEKFCQRAKSDPTIPDAEWHAAVAGKLITLCAISRTTGADRIGASG